MARTLLRMGDNRLWWLVVLARESPIFMLRECRIRGAKKNRFILILLRSRAVSGEFSLADADDSLLACSSLATLRRSPHLYVSIVPISHFGPTLFRFLFS
jgi:hypothetical protein